MHERGLSSLRLLAAMLTLGCACVAPTDDVGAAGNELVFTAIEVAQPGPVIVARPRPRPPTIQVPRGCDRNTLVGIPRYTSSCPAASGSWRGRTGLSGVRTVGRAPICVYEYVGSRSRWSLDGLPHDMGSDDVLWRAPHQWLEPDCHAVVPLADPSVEATLAAVTDAHEAAWRSHIDRVDHLPSIAGSSGAPNLPRTVRVAVLDDVRQSTWGETDFPVAGTTHGQSVALTIRDVLCPNGRDSVCPLDFKSYPVITEGVTGGGSILALAESIVRAARDGADVINLSVGFDEAFAWRGDVETKAYFERAEVLRTALEYAGCRDAVVVAAAGNDGLGPSLPGRNVRPMYPAAFAYENRHRCYGARNELSEPLVYMASGVGPADEDIANTRPGSVAELVAPAFAVTFDDPRPNAGDERLPLRTGSSFGAAGVSAVAALVRAYWPDARAAEVMEVVLGSAVDLDRPANICNSRPQSLCDAHRVTACGALQGALDEVCSDSRYYWSCAWARWGLRCDTPAAGAPTGPVGTAFDPSVVATMLSSSFRSVGPGTCEASTVQQNGSQGHLCPDEAYDNGINDPGSLTEQPGDDPCRVCGMTVASDDPDDWAVVIGLEPELAGQLSSPVLRVGDESYALGDETIAAAASGRVVALPLRSFAYTPASATLSFQNGSGKALSSQLPVW